MVLTIGQAVERDLDGLWFPAVITFVRSDSRSCDIKATLT